MMNVWLAAWPPAARLLTQIVSGIALYGGLSLLLRNEALTDGLSRIRRMLQRRRPAPRQ